MTRGRKMLAPEVKEASGAYAKNPQRRNVSAPKADGDRPEMPASLLCEAAQQKWVDLIGHLAKNGVLSSDTREILIAYCTAYGHWIEARQQVIETGLATRVVDQGGNVSYKRNAYVVEMHKFREQMNKLLPELGLTPASRQKLTAITVDDEKEDAFASIMARMGRG